MGLKQWYRSQSDGVRGGVIVAAATAVVGLIGAAATFLAPSIGDHSPPGLSTLQPPARSTLLSPSPTSFPLPSQTPSLSRPACPSKLMITSPTDGQQVSGAVGVQVTGTACGLVAEYGWVFDHDSEDPYYYEVYPSTPGPIVQGNGAWSVLDQPIGSQGDVGKPYFLTLVLASATCNAALENIPQVDGDYKVLTFPTGCQIIQSVRVVVTYSR